MAEAAQVVLTDAVSALSTTAGWTISRACRVTGLPRASFYRLTRGYCHDRRVPEPVPHRDRHQPAALAEAERAQVIESLVADEYAELSVVQTYWRSFDAGQVSCSQATFYRIARSENLVGDRRRQRSQGSGSRRKRPAPTAQAFRPNQLWSWDATELCGGPEGLECYQLMLILDVYSRFPTGWLIEPTTTSHAAKRLFRRAFQQHGHVDVVHADNGSAMRSADLAGVFTDHPVTGSLSRPRVSNDNPFSESMFKTIKYDIDHPPRFDDIDHARAWTQAFLDRYANHHRHSGIGYYTPAAVYHGTVATDQARRQAQLDAYHAAHPNRFRQAPRAPTVGPTGINTRELSTPG